MFRSWKIGRAFGIDIFIHWTFLLLLGYLLFRYWGNGLEVALYVVCLVVAVFGCVVLHELGHALAARSFNIPTRDITLYPIGGVARLARMSEKPWEEFWIAVAGPAVNVVIAALLIVPAILNHGASSVGTQLVAGSLTGNVFLDLLIANLTLVGFNLLPAFPMDGGRVLRALLAISLGRLQATEVATKIGAGFAGVFALLAFLGSNPLLILGAGFVFLAGQQELAFLRRVEYERRSRIAEASMPANAQILDAVPVPVEPDFCGSVWDPRARVWVIWQNGRPVHSFWIE